MRYLLFPVPCLYPALAAIVLSLAVPLTAKAQSATISLPSAADVGRVTAPTYETPAFTTDSGLLPATPPPALVPAPEAAKNVTLTLKSVTIEGTTIFDKDQLASAYQHYLDRKITLDVVWTIANHITDMYRQSGYFLSRAYVPQQDIEDGHIILRVVEGYIGAVNLDQSYADLPLIKTLTNRILAQRPVNIHELETDLLRLNDLPGVNFRTVFERLPEGQEGEVMLRLIPTKDKPDIILSANNYGSRFLGPFQASLVMRHSILPQQDTTLYLMNTVPTRDSSFVGLYHTIPLTPATSLVLNGDYAHVRPGHTLDDLDIDGVSYTLGVSLQNRIIRTRARNMTLSLDLDARNSNTDTFGFALTRDRIRSLRAGVSYDFLNTVGRNVVTARISQGVGFLGASDKNAPYLSRTDADPDYTKIDASWLHQQFLTPRLLFSGEIAGQYAFSPLFSAEEFGFGGQRFGRAYDPSEVTGDHGLAGAIELRYWGSSFQEKTGLYPFAFYDIGKVWNKGGNGDNVLISSTGLGMRLDSPSSGFNAGLTAAFPLIHRPGAPFTSNPWGPRFLFEASYRF